jgi:hypothetical protein
VSYGRMVSAIATNGAAGQLEIHTSLARRGLCGDVYGWPPNPVVSFDALSRAPISRRYGCSGACRQGAGLGSLLLTPSRPETKTAGNER